MMDYRQRSSTHNDAPEVVSDQSPAGFGNAGYNNYYNHEPPPSAIQYRRHRPVEHYQPPQTDGTLRIPRSSSRGARTYTVNSSIMSDGGFNRATPSSPPVQSPEAYVSEPQAAEYDQEKEVYNTEVPSKEPIYQSYRVSDDYDQNYSDHPHSKSEHEAMRRSNGPLYKRRAVVLPAILILVLIAVGIVLGVVFGRKSGGSDSSALSIGEDNPNVDINSSVGGYINDAYYSTSGAWNGSGIAIAAANTNTDQSIFAFYQDYTGLIQYTLMDPQSRWNLVGPVNANSYKALNGTPLSTVQHQIGDELVWHLFYVDEDYFMRERVITNTTSEGPSPVWIDGPLNNLDLKVWNSNHMGMQACWWGSYYADNGTRPNVGIHLWYASNETTFQEYSWTNGTAAWTPVQEWNDLSGAGGIGCQTWDQPGTEYVWFVDTNNSIAMYWQTSNETFSDIEQYPLNEWAKVDVGVHGVQKDSSLGYTNYMVWQDQGLTIRGANIYWEGQNTRIGEGKGEDGLDTWVLQSEGEDIHAVRGTHLSITVVRTVSDGARVLTFFQQVGNDMQMYTREAFNQGAVWQAAGEDPVVPTKFDR